jgi:hypothetical protein
MNPKIPNFIYVWSWNQDSLESMCGIGTKIVLIYFLESKPKVFHKSKEAPNIGCYVCYFHQTHPQIDSMPLGACDHNS